MTTDKNKEDFMDDLLVKYLLEETDKREKASVEEWINADIAHKIHYEQLQKIWAESAKLSAGSPPEEAAWGRFQQRVHSAIPSENKIRKLNRRRWLAVAASVFIVVGCGLWYILQSQPFISELTIASNNKIITEILPDQTVVTLNKNSTLNYPKKFNKKNRVVELQGEAFFKVTHHEKHPFVVKVNNLTITDIGTEFNINENKLSTEIIVAAGSVKVTSGKHSLILKAGEKVVISKKNGRLKKEKVTNQLYNYYKTKTFVCNNTPLSDLVKTLNEAYDTQIVIASPQLKELPITTTFHQTQSLKSILEIITQTFNRVKLSQQGEKFILHSK